MNYLKKSVETINTSINDSGDSSAIPTKDNYFDNVSLKEKSTSLFFNGIYNIPCKIHDKHPASLLNLKTLDDYTKKINKQYLSWKELEIADGADSDDVKREIIEIIGDKYNNKYNHGLVAINNLSYKYVIEDNKKVKYFFNTFDWDNHWYKIIVKMKSLIANGYIDKEKLNELSELGDLYHGFNFEKTFKNWYSKIKEERPDLVKRLSFTKSMNKGFHVSFFSKTQLNSFKLSQYSADKINKDVVNFFNEIDKKIEEINSKRNDNQDKLEKFNFNKLISNHDADVFCETISKNKILRLYYDRHLFDDVYSEITLNNTGVISEEELTYLLQSIIDIADEYPAGLTEQIPDDICKKIKWDADKLPLEIVDSYEKDYKNRNINKYHYNGESKASWDIYNEYCTTPEGFDELLTFMCQNGYEDLGYNATMNCHDLKRPGKVDKGISGHLYKDTGCYLSRSTNDYNLYEVDVKTGKEKAFTPATIRAYIKYGVNDTEALSKNAKDLYKLLKDKGLISISKYDKSKTTSDEFSSEQYFDSIKLKSGTVLPAECMFFYKKMKKDKVKVGIDKRRLKDFFKFMNFGLLNVDGDDIIIHKHKHIVRRADEIRNTNNGRIEKKNDQLMYISKFIQDRFINEISADFDKELDESVRLTIKDLEDALVDYNIYELIKRNWKTLFDYVECNFATSGFDYEYFPFLNGVVKIQKTGKFDSEDLRDIIQIYSYEEIGLDFWETDILNWNYEITGESLKKPNANRYNSLFALFFSGLCSKTENGFNYFRDTNIQQIINDIEVGKRNSIENIFEVDEYMYDRIASVIGYYLHSYKTKNDVRMYVLQDGRYNPNQKGGGGSGKSLIGECIQVLKKTQFVDGRNFDAEYTFAVNINHGSNFWWFDDVEKMFDSKKLYTYITGDISFRVKGRQHETVIPFEEAPKVMVTSNYTFDINELSTERRVVMVEIADFFKGINFSPRDMYYKIYLLANSKKDWNLYNCNDYVDDRNSMNIGILSNYWGDFNGSENERLRAKKNKYEWNSFFTLMFLFLKRYLEGNRVIDFKSNTMALNKVTLQLDKVFRGLGGEAYDFINEFVADTNVVPTKYLFDECARYIYEGDEKKTEFKSREFSVALKMYFDFKGINAEQNKHIKVYCNGISENKDVRGYVLIDKKNRESKYGKILKTTNGCKYIYDENKQINDYIEDDVNKYINNDDEKINNDEEKTNNECNFENKSNDNWDCLLTPADLD